MRVTTPQIGISSPMTFEELRNGSEFHKVKEHDSGGGFTIYPADQKDEKCLQRFHEIVADADETPPTDKIAPAMKLRKRIPVPCPTPAALARSLFEKPIPTQTSPKDFVNQNLSRGSKWNKLFRPASPPEHSVRWMNERAVVAQSMLAIARKQ